jgi:hypothetical protein
VWRRVLGDPPAAPARPAAGAHRAATRPAPRQRGREATVPPRADDAVEARVADPVEPRFDDAADAR